MTAGATTDERQRKAIADAAYAVLQRVDGPLQLSEILARVQAEGLAEVGGQTPQLALSAALSRDGRFERRGTSNQWALRGAPADTPAAPEADQGEDAARPEPGQPPPAPERDTHLPHVPDLDARLRALGERLLIDSAVVRRIYRSLLAGRHVILTGPPGTGKTELARLLPTLLWSGGEHSGYAPLVVTATEAWGVRRVPSPGGLPGRQARPRAGDGLLGADHPSRPGAGARDPAARDGHTRHHTGRLPPRQADPPLLGGTRRRKPELWALIAGHVAGAWDCATKSERII